MASFPAEITLSANARKVYSEIDKIEKRLAELDKAGKQGRFGKLSKTDAVQTRTERKLLESKKRRLQVNQAIEKSNRNITAGLQSQSRLIQKIAAGEKAAAKEARARQKVIDTQRRQQAKQRSNRGQDIALGAGFPLLFGGGLGQAAAGAVGGALGGFGGAIVAQALVSQLGALNNALKETAAITGSVGEAYDFLSENGLFASEETRRLADELAELGRVEELAQVVTQELVDKIGNEGVQNLKTLDSEFDDLLSGITELGLAIGAFLSKYLAPLIGALNDAVGNINDTNRLKALRAENPEAEAFYNSIVEQRNKRGRITREGLNPFEARAKTLEKFKIEVQPDSLIPVTDKDKERFSPKAAKATREAVSRILQLEQQITREKLKQQSLDAKLVGLRQGKQAGAEFELSQLSKRFEQEEKLVELQRKNALANNKVAGDVEKINELHDERLITLTKEQEIKRIELQLLNTQLKAEEAINDVRNARKTEDVVTKLTRNIQDVQAKVDSPFGGDEAEILRLRVQQTRRQEDALRSLNREREEALIKIEEARAIEDDGVRQKTIEEQLKIVANLDKTKAAYDRLLPALNQVELTQLKQQQLLQKYSGVTSALASGISSVMSSAVEDLVNGTATVEEAFANMFKSIGKAFLDMVAQILAQKAVLAILGAFGGGSNSGSGVGSFFPLGKGFAFAEGGRPPVGQYSVVGENGPELVKFDNAATVYSNPDSRAMLSQYSPGSGMSGGGTIRFESTVINGVEYVTREEAEAIGNRAAQAGARGGHVKSMRTLQNSRSQRAKLGMR